MNSSAQEGTEKTRQRKHEEQDKGSTALKGISSFGSGRCQTSLQYLSYSFRLYLALLKMVIKGMLSTRSAHRRDRVGRSLDFRSQHSVYRGLSPTQKA